MASRFPSLEEFDDGQISPVVDTDTTVLDLEDPGSDFLSREKATLGADAEIFASRHDKDLLTSENITTLVKTDTTIGSGFNSTFPSLNMGNSVRV